MKSGLSVYRTLWTSLGLCMGLLLLAGASHALESADDSPVVVTPDLQSTVHERIWVRPGRPQGPSTISLIVRHPTRIEGDATLSFECELLGKRGSEEAGILFTIRDPAGTRLNEAEIKLTLKEGLGRCCFAWAPVALADGVYIAHFQVLSRAGKVLASRELEVEKRSKDLVSATVKEAAQATRTARDALCPDGSSADVVPDGTYSIYARARAELGEDAVTDAWKALADEDWPRAYAAAQYSLKTADSVRALTALGSLVPELTEPLRRPDFSKLEIRDGAYYVEERPVFLAGAYYRDSPKDLARLSRYGLNLAVVKLSPAQTLAGEAGEKDLSPELQELLREAEESNVTLTFLVAPDPMCAWALEKWPEMTARDHGAMGFDAMHAGARSVVERHLRAAAAYLRDQKRVNGLCLADKPGFRFDGDTVRQRFIAHVESRYGDRHAVNRVWKTHLADLNDIRLWWDKPRAPYQYDLQTHQCSLGTEFLAWMAHIACESAPGTPLLVKWAGNVFDEAETRWAADREAAARLTDVSGCADETAWGHRLYAMDYPLPGMYYALMRSFAPEKPVFDLGHRFMSATNGSFPFDYVRAAVWEAAMNGLGALAVSHAAGDDAADGPSLWTDPEGLDGFITASMDLNRLAPIVAAFQRAPAETALLWSMPSKIYKDGKPYLDSLQKAFEGCSFFGYKVGFVSEEQCASGGLANLKVLVIPDALAVSDAAFTAINRYIEMGGVVIRRGNAAPYDDHGISRRGVLTPTARTVLVRGSGSPTEHLQAMDAAFALGALDPIPRMVNSFGYPLEGVKSRYIRFQSREYLYVLNIRKDPVQCRLKGGDRSGRDLIGGSDVAFPLIAAPLKPLLVRLDPQQEHVANSRH